MRVIILYNKLFHYRIPVWNLLADRCDLTVAYSEGDGTVPDSMEVKFKTMYLQCRTIGGHFVLQKARIRRLVKNYDVIVAYGNIAWLKYSTLPWFSHNKVVFHTLGVSASYGKGFDQNKSWDRIRAFFYNKASALAFYTEYPMEKYVKLGIPKEKMFVAPNTVMVEPIESEVERDSILMMGTLYREKGVRILLDAYWRLKDLDSLPNLIIVGGGPDYELIKEWISNHQMQEKIKLMGPVYDIRKKAAFFSRALACISPKQAGLTVLESMGYGVPFITSRRAITGGEIFNVHSGKDGVIIEDESKMVDVIRDIAENRSRYIEMGKCAKMFYDNNRTIRHMADGLWEAIMYAFKS